MLGWLWRMIVGRFGCEHKWVVAEKHPFEEKFAGTTYATGQLFILRCEKCGNMKRWTTT